MKPLPSPLQLTQKFPLSDNDQQFIEKTRKISANIVQGKSEKKALIVGPCSIHDPESALEYAKKLKTLSEKCKIFLPLMRLFIEKPRTSVGWKGFLYDPDLKGKSDIKKGLESSRKLLLELIKMEVPCAMELLDPLVSPYYEDLLCWGMIGARTSASQVHRQLVSGLPFPVGFKNTTHGELDVAIHGILSSKDPHTHFSIDPSGHICQKNTKGNNFSHLVLRGSNTKSNYDPESLKITKRLLEHEGLNPSVLIDCSHGNSQKNHLLQADAFKACVKQIPKGGIFGLMLESHLFPGKQQISENLTYGVSVTDSCIGWSETEELVLWAEELLCPISMSSVHK